MLIHGTSDDDLRTGTGDPDRFVMFQGGDDTVQGLGGNDDIKYGAAFTAADKVDGGDGDADRLVLGGDYTAGVTFEADTLVGVEQVRLAAGFGYVLTSDDATVGAGRALKVYFDAVGLGETLAFDGSAETDGRFRLFAGDGADALTGGAGADLIHVGAGADVVDAGDGNDRIVVSSMDVLDTFDGGAGDDTLVISGIEGSDTIVLAADSLMDIDRLVLTQGFLVQMHDGNVAAGRTLRVEADVPAGHNIGFDGLDETDGRFEVFGSASSDILRGGAQDDVFDVSAGGVDTVAGGDGDDRFFTGLALGGTDRFIGDAGDDRVIISGVDGGDFLAMGPNTLSEIERLVFRPSFSAAIESHDSNVAAGETLIVSAGQVSFTSFQFNGGAETNGHFAFVGCAGSDILTGGSQADTFHLARGGAENVNGGGGDDRFYLGGQLTESDNVAGGAGNDTVYLDGLDLTDQLIFSATTMTGIDRLVLADASYASGFRPHEATVAAGAVLTVDASALSASNGLAWESLGESDGAFDIVGGAAGDFMVGGGGQDTLSGGAGADTIVGGAAGDVLAGGGGADVYGIPNLAASTSTSYDTIGDLDLDADSFSFFRAGVSIGVDAPVTEGDLSLASFDSDLAAAVGFAQLGAVNALIFTPDGGDLAGRSFLVIDELGGGGYQASQDYVLDITGYVGTLDSSDFHT